MCSMCYPGPRGFFAFAALMRRKIYIKKNLWDHGRVAEYNLQSATKKHEPYLEDVHFIRKLLRKSDGIWFLFNVNGKV